MKNIVILIIIGAGAYYYFNGNKTTCNDMNDVTAKMQALTREVQLLANEGNINKLIVFQSYSDELKRIQNSVDRNNNVDHQAICNTLDDLMDEL